MHGMQIGHRILRKRIHVRIEHVAPSRCREEFLIRQAKNDQIKHEAKERGGRASRCYGSSEAGSACLWSEAIYVLRVDATVLRRLASIISTYDCMCWHGNIAGSVDCMQRCHEHVTCVSLCWHLCLSPECTDAEKPPKTKRGIAQPREGFMIEDVKAQTVTPIPYDIVKEGIQT